MCCVLLQEGQEGEGCKGEGQQGEGQGRGRGPAPTRGARQGPRQGTGAAAHTKVGLTDVI